ncbi:MAG: sigma-70 family RNA polymerase sigma factor [Eubacteriales bacterium]|nr:sigma-70 family RNA polymerase sigma factor [Eubacteriales bacterium]
MKHFEDLYEAYFRPVYRFVLSLCRDTSLAEEVTQRAFWSAWRHFKDFQGKSDVTTWLCKIARNELMQIKRRKAPLPLSEHEANLPSSEPPLESALAEKMQAERIERLVHELDDPYKEVFLLRVYAEFDYRRIAALFGKSESWARVTYFRAKEKIREQLEKEEMI